jgi:hypothetical protein
MQTVPLIALRALTYAGQPVQAGGPFNATERDARLLVAVKRAQPAAAPQAELLPAAEESEAAAPTAPRRAGYKRRDVTAEGQAQ